MKVVWKPAVFLTCLLVLAWCCYLPGVRGGFLFDDFHNLDSLGMYGGVRDWKTLYSYLHSGMAGPSGRPLALLSFLLDDNTWPSFAPWFKITNLWIHLSCGLLLCWVNLLIFRQMRFAEDVAEWLAVIAAAFWFLHPLMLSTTLYVVQRMAQLATFFVLAGFVGYLKGRALLGTRPRWAYGWMSCSLILGTLLGGLSKENGFLFPMMVLVFEFCLASRIQAQAPDWKWQGCFLWAPSAAIFLYLASLIDFSAHPWVERNFNQPERLMTEARIVWEYIHYLFLPQIEGNGLFQDGIEISRGLMTPWRTLPAVIGIIALLLLGIVVRKKRPLLSFAILSFFVGHLIESTVIGLEPYFEHRNYLAAIFVFLPAVVFLYDFSVKKSKEFFPTIILLPLLFFSFLLWKRAELWSDTQKLELYWAQSSPNSPRAQNSMANYLLQTGRADQGIDILTKALERMPQSSFLNFSLLIHKVNSRQAKDEDFERAIRRLLSQPLDAQVVLAMRTLVDNVNLSAAPESYRLGTLKLISAIEKNPAYVTTPALQRLVPYLRGKIYLRQRKFDEACTSYQKALTLYANISSGMNMVAENAMGGNSSCALKLLDQAEAVLAAQKSSQLDRPREDYKQDVIYIRQAIKAGLHEVPSVRQSRGDVK